MSGSPPGEKRIFVGLRDDPVAKNWIVLHSYTLSQHVKQEKGEMDFLVMAPGLGILVVEVKSHRRVTREDGTWFLGNDAPTTRSPFEQAEMNRYSLKEQLKRSGWRVPPMRSVVVFTNLNFRESSQEWLPWQCIDKSQIDLHGVGGSLRSSFNGMREHLKLTKRSDELLFDAEEATRLATFLRGDFEVAESLSAITKDRFEEYHNFLEEQFEALDQLDENPRILFQGAAGTGKTLLALEVARRAVQSDKRVIVLCRNRYLSNFLRSSLGEHENIVFCGTYHALMLKMTGYRSSADSGSWFDSELPERTIELLLEQPPGAFEFDVLVVDEAQDLASENVLTFLSLLTIVYNVTELRFFGDFVHQLLFFQDRGAKESLCAAFPNMHSFYLWTNCRNREGVGDLICTLSDKKDIYKRFRLKGRENCVQFHYYESEMEKIELLEGVVSDLTKSFPLGEIVVLGLKSELDPSLLSQSLGNRFYSSEPEDMSQRRKIFSTSARKFKGLESQAIIVHDFGIGEDEDVIYAAVSRAVERLVLIVDRANQVSIVEQLALRA